MSRLLQYLLIVDDNAGVCQLLYEFFKDKGYDVETAGSGVDALSFVRKKIPALVILDMKMPRMNGLATIKKMREIAPKIPVVMMTAYTDMDAIIVAQREGLVQYCIGKPFDLKEMYNLVKEALCNQATKYDLNLKTN